MGVSAVDGEVGVGEGPAGAIEGVPVPVLAVLEPHVDMDGTAGLLEELQLGHVGPHTQGRVDLTVHLLPGKSPLGRVFRDFVSQRLHFPPRSLQSEPPPPADPVRPHHVLHSAPRGLHQGHRPGVQLSGHVKTRETLELLHVVPQAVPGQERGGLAGLGVTVHVSVLHEVHLVNLTQYSVLGLDSPTYHGIRESVRRRRIMVCRDWLVT